MASQLAGQQRSNPREGEAEYVKMKKMKLVSYKLYTEFQAVEGKKDKMLKKRGVLKLLESLFKSLDHLAAC